MSTRIRRICLEAVLAGLLYSRTRRVLMGPRGEWVQIKDFPLPRGYNRRTTPILLKLPANYPLSPPQWFYLKRGLRYRGKKPPHYFEDLHVPEELQKRGWAAGCLHILEWRPAHHPLMGHSLVTVCQLIADALYRWARWIKLEERNLEEAR